MEKLKKTTSPIMVPRVMSSTGSLVIEQSDELLHEVDFHLAKPALMLQTQLRYSITKESLRRLDELGVEAFGGALSTFEFDISPFYDEFVSLVKEDSSSDKRKRHDIRTQIKKAENSLIRPLCMCNEDGTIREYVALYNSIKIDEKERICTVKVDNRILPLYVPEINQIKERHLLDLARMYSFKNQGASKLYALINGTVQQLAISDKDEAFVLDLTYLKNLFGLAPEDTNYTTKFFMQRLFVPAYEEIIATSDIRFQYKPVRQGRIFKSLKIFDFERIPDENNREFFARNENVFIDVKEEDIRIAEPSDWESVRDESGKELVGNIVSLFSDECSKDGFASVEAVLKLAGAFGGNLENYKRARNAYNVMAELNAVEGDKLDFFLNLAEKL